MQTDEIVVQNTQIVDPTITDDDSKAFDTLADSVFNAPETTEGDEKKTDVVQAPVKEEPKKDVKVEQEQVQETPEQIAAKEKAAKETSVAPTDKELDEIQPPKHLSPKNMAGWEALKSLAKTRGEQLAQVQKELEEIRPKVGQPDPALLQEKTTLEQELAKYRALYQGERSPEFVAKYDSKMQANDAKTEEILTRNGMPKETLDKLKAVGLSKVEEKYWEENILPALGRRDRLALQNALDENFKLGQERDKELEEIRTKPEEFQKKIEEETQQKFQTYTKELAETVNTLTKDIPWCKVQPIPADATPEVKARLEAENKFYQESEIRFQAMLYPKTPQVRAETALAACLSFKLASDLEQMQTFAKNQVEANKVLQGELDAIKKAGVTSLAGRNISTDAAKKAPDISTMSDDDAIEAGLKAAGA